MGSGGGAHAWRLGPPKAPTAGLPAVRDGSGFLSGVRANSRLVRFEMMVQGSNHFPPERMTDLSWQNHP